MRGKTRLNKTNSSNSYSILPDSDPNFVSSEADKDGNGITKGGVYIKVKDSRKDTETGAHEIGHSLGFKLLINTLMSEASNIERNLKLNPTVVGVILKNVGIGRVNYDPDYKGSGRGNTQHETGTAPPDFKSGKIVKKKNP